MKSQVTSQKYFVEFLREPSLFERLFHLKHWQVVREISDYHTDLQVTEYSRLRDAEIVAIRLRGKEHVSTTLERIM